MIDLELLKNNIKDFDIKDLEIGISGSIIKQEMDVEIAFPVKFNFDKYKRNTHESFGSIRDLNKIINSNDKSKNIYYFYLIEHTGFISENLYRYDIHHYVKDINFDDLNNIINDLISNYRAFK